MCVQKKALAKVTYPFNLVCFRASTEAATQQSCTPQCILLSLTGRQASFFTHLKSQLHLNPKALGFK